MASTDSTQDVESTDAKPAPPGLLGRSVATLQIASASSCSRSSRIVSKSSQRVLIGSVHRWKQRALVQTALLTTAQFYTVGGGHEAWDLRTSIFTAIARAISAESRKKEDPERLQDPVKAIQAVRSKLKMIEMKNPKFGACVPMEVPVKPQRGLGGILEPLDRDEKPGRTIPAEWELHKSVRGKANERVLLYLHGGGYTLLNPRTHRPMTLHLSQELGCRVLSVDYRLAPETVFPGALYDAVTALLYLTEELKISPSNILIGGDSAGAGLCLSLMLYMRDTKMDQIAGAILLSPFCDLTHSLKTWESNAHLDYLSMPVSSSPMLPAKLYAPDEPLHPYVTSVLSDLSNLPPLIMQAGGAETLRDEVTLLAQLADRAGGTDVTHEIYESGVHVTHMFVDGELARTCREQVSKWAARIQPSAELKKREEGWNDVDRTFGGEWDRLAKAAEALKKKNKGYVAEEGPKTEPAYLFEGFEREAPKIELRSDANERVTKIVEENEEYKPRLGLTTIFVPRRNPKAGLVGKVRGVLHL